jgi:hypothetical protein
MRVSTSRLRFGPLTKLLSLFERVCVIDCTMLRARELVVVVVGDVWARLSFL